MTLVRMRHKSAVKKHVVADAKKIVTPSGDPTGTGDIRKRNRTLIDLRWRKFTQLVKQAVVEQDMLNLRPDKPTALGLALSGMGQDAKTKAFQTWVDATLNRIVLEGQADYLDPMIEIAYRRGLLRAQRLSKAVVAPNMRDVIWNLQQLTLTELQGICEAVSQRLVRLAANAQLDSVKPQALFVEAKKGVESIGMVRSHALVDVMVVKTHGQATLDTFEAAGIKKVGLLPETVRPVRTTSRTSDATETNPTPRSARELSRTKVPTAKTLQSITRAEQRIERKFKAEEVEVVTAGDDLVCPECEDISADGPYTINEARSLIPAHPHCRCTFVPESMIDLISFGEE